jgi:hypothetical protein
MDKIDIATAVWNVIMLTNYSELKRLKKDERYAIMQAIYMAITHVIDPNISLDEITRQEDIIQKYVTAVYEELERMRIMIMKGDYHG